MDADRRSPSNARTFWDWFLIGAMAGLVYNLLRNPGTCACAAGCLLLVVLLAVVVLVALLVQHPGLLIIAAGLVALVLWARRRARLRG